MSVFKKKEMAIDHLFRAISLFCCGVSIALSMNKHVPKAPKKKNMYTVISAGFQSHFSVSKIGQNFPKKIL